MTRRNKLQKFAEVLTYPNVYENFDHTNKIVVRDPETQLEIRGKWNSFHFQNENPLTLELACGRGEYSLALARDYPERNFVGVDIKGARIWKGATIAIEENLTNVAFLRSRIEMIGDYFAPDEVDEVWITFPDPFLRESKENNRLTSPLFLDRYRPIAKPGGLLHLKTDDPTLYEYSLETLGSCDFLDMEYTKDDIYAEPLDFPELAYKTYYERMHLDKQRTIKYIRCRFK